MFATKGAKPETKRAAGSTHAVARQEAARPFGGGATEEDASILGRTIGNEATPREPTPRLSNARANASGVDFSRIPVALPDPAYQRHANPPEIRSPRLFPRSAARHDVRSVLDGPGHSLDRATLRDFRTRLGYDFSSVRVHVDQRAAESAASLSARAYAIGRHVVFGRGEYAPGTTTGRHLLGHELAHVIQQTRGGSVAPGAANPGLEAAAERAANQASRGARVQVAGGSAIGIACKTLFDELSGGVYSWNFLKLALEHTRPAETIVDDIKGLSDAERAQAIKDIEKERDERQLILEEGRAKRAAQADPKLQAVWDPILQERERVLTKIYAVLTGLRIPGWNFRPGDFAKLQQAGQGLTMAPDSGWFPAKLQENLRKTLEFVLDPQRSPAATEGVNAVDFFHGHLVVKKDPATKKEVKAATARSKKFSKKLHTARTKALGEVKFGKPDPLTDPKNIAVYQKVLEKAQPSHASLLEDTAKIPGAAVMYHTFEFITPSDVKAKGQKKQFDDPRRHYVTPLDTNTPRQYSPPSPATYEKEFTHVTRFVFLVDDKGAVHVRPFEPASSFLTHELSTITGTTLPDTLDFEK
jgi:Domain of unknown function (DUF4157)